MSSFSVSLPVLRIFKTHQPPRGARSDALLRRTSKNDSRGFLIALEGIDGTGKSTQFKRLLSYLESIGYAVVGFKEPSEGKWGTKIRELAKKGRDTSARTEFLYFLRDRKEDVNKNILPALKAGKVVVMDRYYYSSMAYQGARGMNYAEIEKENLKFAPKPDVTFLIDVTPKTAEHRIRDVRGQGTDHFEERLGAIRDAFLEIARSHDEVEVVDGERDPDRVFADIVSHLRRLMPSQS